MMNLATKVESAFVSIGFTNWKKAIEKFQYHQKCSSHNHAVTQLLHSRGPIITARLCEEKAVEQSNARVALLRIMSSVQYLARQGLALRGHSPQSGNLYQLLHLRSKDVPQLAQSL